MSITQNRVKVRNYPEGHEKNFISYFQSVTTVGIVSRAKNIKEASQLANKKLSESGFTCGVINMTPMSESGTEEWKPDLSALPCISTKKESASTLTFSQTTKNCIASHLLKKPEEISDADCVRFLDGNISNWLSPAE